MAAAKALTECVKKKAWKREISNESMIIKNTLSFCNRPKKYERVCIYYRMKGLLINFLHIDITVVNLLLKNRHLHIYSVALEKASCQFLHSSSEISVKFPFFFTVKKILLCDLNSSSSFRRKRFSRTYVIFSECWTFSQYTYFFLYVSILI